jgi:predicted dehydrogenase
MTQRYRTRIEDASTIILRFANGAHGIVDNYFNLPDAAAQNTLELHGTRGSIVGQGTIGQDPTGRMFSILQEQETGYDANQVRTNTAQREEYHFAGPSLYGQMIAAFNRCIREDGESPVTLEEGRHSVRLIEAIYKAVAEKRVVPVD